MITRLAKLAKFRPRRSRNTPRPTPTQTPVPTFQLSSDASVETACNGNIEEKYPELVKILKAHRLPVVLLLHAFVDFGAELAEDLVGLLDDEELMDKLKKLKMRPLEFKRLKKMLEELNDAPD
jgi:hypothetical protein